MKANLNYFLTELNAIIDTLLNFKMIKLILRKYSNISGKLLSNK